MIARFFLVTVLLNCGTVALATKETVQKKVLIIGIDGCRPDALLKAKAPHLGELMRDGAFSDKAQTGPATISGPGWSSMLTGVWMEKHGVRDNNFAPARYKQFPHFFQRLKQANPRAFTVSISHWEPINKHIVTSCDLVSSPKTASRVADETVEVLSRRDPDAVFVHFDHVDGAGHKFGFHPSVPGYLKAIEEADLYVGQIMKALRGRKTFAREDWLILVSTDHGGSDKGHGKDIPEHRTIFLIVSGPSAVRGNIEPAPMIVDVAVTALVHLGVPIDPKWDLDGKAVGLKRK
jgi:predicted AlkP superfamily pyrophosphatase or phosphodiesterase